MPPIPTSEKDTIHEVFSRWVPELLDGTVAIKAVARIPGVLAKVALMTHSDNVDPVRVCVGNEFGDRIQNIEEQLGEPIDLIPFSDDPGTFVYRALSPGTVESLLIDDDSKSMEVVFKSDQLEALLGEDGINARLASMLTGWQLTFSEQK